MGDTRVKVLLILAQDVLDRARVVAGRATITLKLPVSLQVVLRALTRSTATSSGVGNTRSARSY
jgi:hypothetical protein